MTQDDTQKQAAIAELVETTKLQPVYARMREALGEISTDQDAAIEAVVKSNATQAVKSRSENNTPEFFRLAIANEYYLRQTFAELGKAKTIATAIKEAMSAADRTVFDASTVRTVFRDNESVGLGGGR